MSQEEELEQEIKDRQAKLKKLQNDKKDSARSKAVKELSEFSDEEKIAGFDAMHARAIADLAKAEGDSYSEDNDDDHWAWEAQMNVIARDNKSFWDYYNSYF